MSKRFSKTKRLELARSEKREFRKRLLEIHGIQRGGNVIPEQLDPETWTRGRRAAEHLGFGQSVNKVLQSMGYTTSRARKISREQLRQEAQKIREILKERGIMPGDNVLYNQHCNIGINLRTYSRHAGFGINVKQYLESLGYETDRSPDSVERTLIDLREIYPQDLVAAAVEGRTKLPSISDAMKKSKHVKSYMNLASRRNRTNKNKIPQFRHLMKLVWPDCPYLPILASGKVKYEDLTAEEARRMLQSRYNRREDCSSSGMDDLEGKILRSWTIIWHSKELHKKKASGDKRSRKNNYTEAISALMGWDPRHFTIQNPDRKHIGMLSENLATMVLYAIQTFGADKFPESFTENFLLPISRLSHTNNNGSENSGIKLVHEKGSQLTDLVIESETGANMIEVKNVRAAHGWLKKSLEHRFYDNPEKYWLHPENRDFELPVKKKTLIIHSKDSVSKEIESFIAQKNVKRSDNVFVVSPQNFRSALESALSQMNEKGYFDGRVYTHNEILSIYDIISRSPHILLRPSMYPQFSFLEQTVQELCMSLQNRQQSFRNLPLLIYGKEGELVQTPYGPFRRFLFTLDDIPDSPEFGEVKRCIMDRFKRLPENVVGKDLETTGFRGRKEFQIILDGNVYRQNGVVYFDIRFAQNPWQEAAMIYHACKNDSGKKIFTYNGRTFDIGAMEERRLAHIIPEHLKIEHDDVFFNLLKRGKRRPLRYWGEKAFGIQRHDPPGSRIQEIYLGYISTGNPIEMEGVATHIVFDLATLLGLHLYPERWQHS
jgi:uncharacterized protein YprB with RNaseH-like and TPR domain